MSGAEPGDTAVYTCHPGYEHPDKSVSRSLVCNSHFDWAGGTIDCIIRTCQGIPTLRNSNVLSATSNLRLVKYGCSQGTLAHDGQSIFILLCDPHTGWRAQYGRHAFNTLGCQGIKLFISSRISDSILNVLRHYIVSKFKTLQIHHELMYYDYCYLGDDLGIRINSEVIPVNSCKPLS